MSGPYIGRLQCKYFCIRSVLLPQMTMVDTIDTRKSETINEPLSDWLTIIPHLPHALVPLALLYYCPIAKPPLPPFWPRFTQGRWIIWSSGLPQWRTMGGSGVSVESEHGAIGRPGKSCTMPHAPTQPSTLCKARPSWKRTYFAPGVNSRKMVKFSQGRRRAGLQRGT